MPKHVDLEEIFRQDPVILDWTRVDVSLCDCFRRPNHCSASGDLCTGGNCPKMTLEVLDKYYCTKNMCDFWHEEFLKLQEVIRAGRYL